jgi:D-specific alpha-keto acid dehydrogenase
LTTGKKPLKANALAVAKKLPNVLITPHTAYYTEHALCDTVENTILNCLKFERRKRHG